LRNNLTLLILSLLVCRAAQAQDVYVCMGAQASPDLQQTVTEFIARAPEAPLFKALHSAGGSSVITAQSGEELLDPKALDRAAHNHLMVIGLPSDPLMKKVLGYTVGIDESKKQLQSLGWGRLEGDIGWIESDRNPFLHSRKFKSAPEGTLLVKISGTSEAGIKAALQAFEKGMLNGIVPAGSFSRPSTTLLDLDPLVEPVPVNLPREIDLKGQTGYLAGWSQIPANEYRAVLEATGREPLHIWRYKYLAPGFLKEKSIERWLAGPHRQAFGNAFEIMEFRDETEASQAMLKMARENFKPITLEGISKAKEGPQATDEIVEKPIWNVIVAATGRYVVLSTLPPEATSKLAQLLPGASAVAP